MSSVHFQSQSMNWSQTFLKSQTHLLKGLLTDKGGTVPACKLAVVRQWLNDHEASESELEREFKALVQVYEELLAEPRPFNLRRVKARGKPPQLQWRLPNESGSQVVVALFDNANDAGREALSVLSAPLIAALLEVEAWRLTLNWLASLHQTVSTSAEDFLRQLTATQAQRHAQLLPEAK